MQVATGRGAQGFKHPSAGYLWQACAYTIHSMEWIQRAPDKALLGQFTTRQEEMLRSLIMSAALEPVNIQIDVWRRGASSGNLFLFVCFFLFSHDAPCIFLLLKKHVETNITSAWVYFN
jgi:hypothetical protein